MRTITRASRRVPVKGVYILLIVRVKETRVMQAAQRFKLNQMSAINTNGQLQLSHLFSSHTRHCT